MAVLVLAEHTNTALNDATAKAVSAAAAMGGDIHVLVAGSGAKAAADAAAKLAGVAKVLLAESADLAHGLAEPVADLLVSLAGGYDAVVAPATANGKNILPRAAALLTIVFLAVFGLSASTMVLNLGPRNRQHAVPGRRAARLSAHRSA